MAAAGPLALVSQSGALTSSILDGAARNGVGFSAVISLVPNTAVKLPQALDFLANDGSTQSIPVYMEGIRNARRFTSKCCLTTLLDPRRGRAASAGPGDGRLRPARGALHERAARRRLCQAGGGDEGRPHARRQPGGADAFGRYRRQ